MPHDASSLHDGIAGGGWEGAEESLGDEGIGACGGGTWGDEIPLRDSVHRMLESWYKVPGVLLVLHGGIGDGSWGLNELEQTRRPLQKYFGPGVPSLVLQVMWSDPSDSDAAMLLVSSSTDYLFRLWPLFLAPSYP